MRQHRSNVMRGETHPLGLLGVNQLHQRGLTMIELLVAMVISMVIALAAVSALTVTRRGFTTVDASSQLRDNGLFAADLIQRLAGQAGYKDTRFATQSAENALASVSGMTADPDPHITGFNNALIHGTDPVNQSITRTAGVDGYGSDILILRYQGVETYPESGVSDQSVIDCAGFTATTVPADKNDRMVSIIHVAVSNGEPTLMCSRSATGVAPFDTQPIVQGVENFQVLYGMDVSTTATPNTAMAPAVSASGAKYDYNFYSNNAPRRFYRADQLTVTGNTAATKANWRLVRSLRIGMVLRGAANSQQERVSQTFYPFGLAKSSSGGADGSAMADNTNDPNTAFTPAVDGRMRQTRSFTVQLRNEQNL